MFNDLIYYIPFPELRRWTTLVLLSPWDFIKHATTNILKKCSMISAGKWLQITNSPQLLIAYNSSTDGRIGKRKRRLLPTEFKTDMAHWRMKWYKFFSLFSLQISNMDNSPLSRSVFSIFHELGMLIVFPRWVSFWITRSFNEQD